MVSQLLIESSEIVFTNRISCCYNGNDGQNIIQDLLIAVISYDNQIQLFSTTVITKGGFFFNCSPTSNFVSHYIRNEVKIKNKNYISQDPIGKKLTG